MPLLHAILLGILQGLTEFLPVSSSAHLIIVPWMLGWDDGGLTFDVALHVGTLAAVILFFFRDWIQIIGQAIGLRAGGDAALLKNRGLLWLLILGTIPGAAAGVLFDKQAETALRSPYIIATAAIVVGLCRALDRPTAARFSFLLSTPIIAGAAAKKFWDLTKHGGGLPQDMQMAFLAGILASAITGCLAIAFFLNYLRRRSLAVFVWYRIIFGIMVIALAFFRAGGR